MGKIFTATGRSFDTDYFVLMQNTPYLFLRILNVPIDNVRTIFSDPNETSCIRCGNQTAFGYINLSNIFEEGDAVKVVLTK